jgi:hypothetical protein
MDHKEMIKIATGPGAAKDTARRGLNFLCFNANIERQFEFIQHAWCNNPTFAGLNGSSDPLLGAPNPHPSAPSPNSFTIHHDQRGEVKGRFTGLPNFVKVVGSVYLFMPSISAIRLLATGFHQKARGVDLESPPPDEQVHIDSVIDTLRERMKNDYVDRKMLRDAHPKMHGCVKARLTVDGGLDPSLSVGLFAKPRTYNAWVRFSNQDGRVSPDRKPDVRAVAIKLLGVEGMKLLDSEEHSTTHDFLLISHDVFFAKDVAEVDALNVNRIGSLPFFVSFFLRHPRVAWSLLLSLPGHGSPLEIQYYSVTPYLFGDRAVKYSLRPRSEERTPIAHNPSNDYLREAMKAHLQHKPAVFDFMVQLQGDKERMPVENPTKRWSQAESPFIKVATLEIFPQEFDTPERAEFADELSFDPWRALPEHRPLGGINRARRQIYRALSLFRHERNTTPRKEPTLEGWNSEPKDR